MGMECPSVSWVALVAFFLSAHVFATARHQTSGPLVALLHHIFAIRRMRLFTACWSALDLSSIKSEPENDMKMKKGSIAVAILSLSLAQQTLAADSDPPIPSPTEVDDPVLPAVLSEIADSDRRSILRLKPHIFEAQKSEASGDSRLVDFVGTVKINPAFLSKPAEPIVNTAGAVLGFGLPRDMARLQLDVAGDRYELFYFDEQKDTRYGFRHVTMSVLNHERSYARFTVDDRSGRVLGAIYTPSQTLRIVPGTTAGRQDVYLSDGGRLNSQSDALREQHDPSFRLLAWRHQQLESVATIGAEYAEARHESRSSYIRGGNLGHLKRVNAKEFVRAAAELTSITQFTGSEIFRVSETLETESGGRRVRLHQIIDGIPVDVSNEVAVDSSGKILELGTLLAPSDFTPISPLLSQADARRRAIAEWEGQVSSKFKAEGSPPKGTLRYRPNGSINELELVYEFRLTGGSLNLEYLARVNALTGTVEIVPLFSHNFGYLTCKDLYVPPPPPQTPPPPPNSCPAPSTSFTIPIKQYAIPAATGYNCAQPPAAPSAGLCTEGRSVVEVLNGMRTVLSGAAATNPSGVGGCCSQMSIEVMSNRRLLNDAMTSSLGRILIPGSEGASAEILAHEVAHAYHYAYNSNLTGTLPLFPSAVREGMADTIAGLYGALSSNPSNFGNQWIHGDGPGYPDSSRSASNSSYQYWQNMQSGPGVNQHTAGQVIYRFFRRLQEISGAGNQRMLGIALGTLEKIRDTHGNGFDAGDFRTAVLASLHSNETALKNAVQTVYAELYQAVASGPNGPPLPPGEPGPSGSPSAPAPYWGSFSFCGTDQGVAVSIYQTFWPASSGATLYGLYVKGQQEPAYRLTDSTTGTTSYIFTNIPGDGRINACNGNGCSGLSPDAVVVSHQPQCGGG
jgi:hypothetical protein